MEIEKALKRLEDAIQVAWAQMGEDISFDHEGMSVVDRINKCAEEVEQMR